MRRRVWPAALIASASILVGCGDESSEPSPGTTQNAATNDPERSSDPRVERARCPEDVLGCVSASGTILYVERVDPDGDGDAHFVLLSSESITVPGITVVDVRRDLRPDPLPGPGDELSAAGPVFAGSYGQRQIHAEVVNVARGGAIERSSGPEAP